MIAYLCFTVFINPTCNSDNPVECLDKIIIKKAPFWLLFIIISSLCLTIVMFQAHKSKYNIITAILSLLMTIYLIKFHYGLKKSLNLYYVDF